MSEDSSVPDYELGEDQNQEGNLLKNIENTIADIKALELESGSDLDKSSRVSTDSSTAPIISMSDSPEVPQLQREETSTTNPTL